MADVSGGGALTSRKNIGPREPGSVSRPKQGVQGGERREPALA